MGRACSTRGKGEKRVESFGRQTLNGRDHLKDLGLDGRIILEWILYKQSGRFWTVYIWLTIGARGGLL
jgi:hypothetical protein